MRTIRTTTSTSGTRTGPRRTRSRPSSGCARRFAASRRTGKPMRCSLPRCRRRVRPQRRRASASWQRSCRRPTPSGRRSRPARAPKRFRAASSGSSPRWRSRRFAASTARSRSTGQREQKELATFHLDRGRRLFEQGSNSEAVTELARAIYLSPYEAAAHLLLGRIYLRTGQTAAAIDAFKIALWSQESVEGRIALAQAYLQVKDAAGARAGAGACAGPGPEFLRSQGVTR